MRPFFAVPLMAVFCLSAGLIPAQVRNDPPTKADSLEKMQADALKNNTDVKVAEAKLKLAEAQLEQARAKLMADISVAFAEAEAARAGFEEGNHRYEMAMALAKRRAISQEDFSGAKLTMIKLKMEMAVAEARLQALVGRPVVIEKRENKKNP